MNTVSSLWPWKNNDPNTRTILINMLPLQERSLGISKTSQSVQRDKCYQIRIQTDYRFVHLHERLISSCTLPVFQYFLTLFCFWVLQQIKIWNYDSTLIIVKALIIYFQETSNLKLIVVSGIFSLAAASTINWRRQPPNKAISDDERIEERFKSPICSFQAAICIS